MSVGSLLHAAEFYEQTVVSELGDSKASPVPEAKEFNYREYAIASSARYPLIEDLKFTEPVRSMDVNALDEIVTSAWYTPRLTAGIRDAKEWIKGLEKIGMPQAPYEVIKIKSEGSAPGFIIRDKRGVKYLIKFDDSLNPGLETTANFVLNRLFWGFGYYVPEDYIVEISREDLRIGTGSKVADSKIDKVFLEAGTSLDKPGRVTASLFLEGKVLGYAPQKGVRKDDLNDKIPHENLRALRGLRLLSAWVHDTGFRSDRWLDVYVGEPGQGHVIHYLLDFGEVFGVHAMNWEDQWESHEYFFSWSETIKKIFGFGVKVEDFEKLPKGEVDPLTLFSVDLFDPERWETIYPYMPFCKALPDDDYWAAKMIAMINEEDLRVLFQEAKHPADEEVDVLIKELMSRKEKSLRYAFSEVTPLEGHVEGSELILEDQATKYLNDVQENRYVVSFQNKKGKRLVEDQEIEVMGPNFYLTLAEDVLIKSKGYLKVLIQKRLDEKKKSQAAEFHIGTEELSPKLIGVLH